jgi:acetyl-CoA synthetase
VDDVINVAGHRLGTKELESAALTVEAVSEAAAVPAYDELKGRVPELYVSTFPGFDEAEVEDQVKKTITSMIGPIARPTHVWVTADLPKTRSGKIMRRVVAAISNFMDPGDTTTLANPEIVEDINRQVRAAKVAIGDVSEDERRKLEMEVEAYGES